MFLPCCVCCWNWQVVLWFCVTAAMASRWLVGALQRQRQQQLIYMGLQSCVSCMCPCGVAGLGSWATQKCVQSNACLELLSILQVVCLCQIVFQLMSLTSEGGPWGMPTGQGQLPQLPSEAVVQIGWGLHGHVPRSRAVAGFKATLLVPGWFHIMALQLVVIVGSTKRRWLNV